MKNWQSGDVPVAEHALWFPTCELIRDVINRNDVRIEDKTTYGASGEPETGLSVKDVNTIANENQTVKTDDHKKVSENPTSIRQTSKPDSMNSQSKDATEEIVRENEELKSQLQCKICMDNDADVVFLPCGHMVACTTCARALRKCAVCRALIKGTLKSCRM